MEQLQREKLDQLQRELNAARAQIANLSALAEDNPHDSLRVLADAMPQMVWITRPDGYHEFYNRMWWEYTGLTYDQARGEGWNLLLHPEDRQRSIDRWQLALRTSEPYEIEYRFKRASDGMYRWFLGRALPYRDESGRIIRWFGTCTDIHDQKLAEEALRRSKEESERLNKAKDEFLAVLSHELRTPLSAILGWVQLVQMNALNSEEVVDAIATIKQNAKIQAQLIEDMLDVSRIINNKLELRTGIVDLATVVQSAIEVIKPSADEKKLRIDFHNQSEDMLIEGDEHRLQQVIWNLLSNAVKFTPAGGCISIRLDRVQSMARISVTDTGRGIPPGFLPHVFERFRQADSSSTRSQGGLGLGLAIVRHLVELHGGSVSVLSDGENKGAVFTVLLPMVAMQADGSTDPTKVAVKPTQTALSGVRVLAVDDEESARILVGACLRKFGASPMLASSVDEALDILDKQKVDVLVSDIAMPGRDGYQLIQAVRTSRLDLAHTPAIALTAYASIEDRNRALSAGFDMHVSKPAEPTELITAILRLLQFTRAAAMPPSATAPGDAP